MKKGDGKKRKLFSWGFMLIFLLSCLCVGMLMPQEAEAKTVKKTVSNSYATITLYDDHTVSAVNGTTYCSKHRLYCQYPNIFGECGLNGLTNVLDIQAGGSVLSIA